MAAAVPDRRQRGACGFGRAAPVLGAGQAAAARFVLVEAMTAADTRRARAPPFVAKKTPPHMDGSVNRSMTPPMPIPMSLAFHGEGLFGLL